MNDQLALDAANNVRDVLENGLEDYTAPTVTLRRDEAILALGMVCAVIETIKADMARRGGSSLQ